MDVLAQAFAIQADDLAAYQVKNLETQFEASPVEIGTSSVRLFVAFYLGLPFDLSTDIYLPETAAALLQDRPLSPEQSVYLAKHTASPVGEAAGEQVTQPVSTPEATAPASEATAQIIKGKTTFAELLDWGVSQATIEQILNEAGASFPVDTSITIKNFCTDNNLDFESIKLALQAAVDALK
jgi:hypothetical protein